MKILRIQDICEQFGLRENDGRIAGKSGSITGGGGTFLVFTTYLLNGKENVEMLRGAGCTQPYANIVGLWRFDPNVSVQMLAAVTAIGVSKAAMNRVEKALAVQLQPL